ncbi:uncharacterized protein LOC110677112 [Aedes aegypti]|uniref:AIG1-type G domain-containing protein n=1 Tax=Aedes aegypti TaxID=7159 RepID=A0A6I8U1A2_AEDAE|nr:uncharacterized protein LOC110677112 [Aedes aegypti]
MDFSRQEEKTQEYNIIIIGETGSGKSTLINYLTNFFHGGNLNQLRLSIPSKHYEATEGLNHYEQNVADTSKSQTSKCTEYNFHKDELLFGFIDTPGLCDTEETNNDEKNILEIMQTAVEKGTLVAIMIVVNGTQSRATACLRHALDEMKNMIPDSFLGNIIVVLTNCNRATANFDISQLKPWQVIQQNQFHMNNSILSKPESAWINDPYLKKHIEEDWNESMKTIGRMIDRLKHLGCQATTAFEKMHQQRDQIMSNLHHILNHLGNLQNLQNELDDAELSKRGILKDIKKYSNYKQTREVAYTEIEESQFLSHICASCSRICYEDWVAKASLRGRFTKRLDDWLKYIKGIAKSYLTVLGENYCDKCHCPDHEHYHDHMKPVKKMKTIENIIDEIKASHDHYMQRNVEVDDKISELHDDMAAIKIALHLKEAAILTCCEELKEVCSQFNFVKALSGIIEILKKRASSLRYTSARNDAYDRINNITRVFNDLSSVQSKRKTI